MKFQTLLSASTAAFFALNNAAATADITFDQMLDRSQDLTAQLFVKISALEKASLSHKLPQKPEHYALFEKFSKASPNSEPELESLLDLALPAARIYYNRLRGKDDDALSPTPARHRTQTHANPDTNALTTEAGNTIHQPKSVVQRAMQAFQTSHNWVRETPARIMGALAFTTLLVAFILAFVFNPVHADQPTDIALTPPSHHGTKTASPLDQFTPPFQTPKRPLNISTAAAQGAFSLNPADMTLLLHQGEQTAADSTFVDTFAAAVQNWTNASQPQCALRASRRPQRNAVVYTGPIPPFQGEATALTQSWAPWLRDFTSKAAVSAAGVYFMSQLFMGN